MHFVSRDTSLCEDMRTTTSYSSFYSDKSDYVGTEIRISTLTSTSTSYRGSKRHWMMGCG